MARAFVPPFSGDSSLGVSSKKWGDIYANEGHIADRNIRTDGVKLDSHDSAITTLQEDVNVLKYAYAGPLKASTVAEMTDTTKVYVYVGTEAGYTAGNWYYHNGTAWTDGGVYNATAVETDETLSIEGAPADAKKTGEVVNLFKVDSNDEYAYVMLDSENRILFGVKKDGSFDWQKGLPKPVREKLEEVAQTVIDSEEFVQLTRDADGHILSGIKADGTFTWQKGVPTPIVKWVDEKNPLYGKRWYAFGDSLTYSLNDSFMHYHNFVAKETGIISVDKGRGGSGYMNPSGRGHEAFWERIQEINPDDFDVLTIFGSGNDCNQNRFPLGTIDDTTTDTVLGCVNLTFEAYFDIAYNKPIGIVTPTPWAWYPPSTNNWMAQYVDGLLKIVERYGLPCLDMYHESGFATWKTDFANMFTLNQDGHHPNEKGHKFIAPKFREFLYTLV